MNKHEELVKKSQKRKSFVFKHLPSCMKCGTKQVQCVEWVCSPAKWKCRKCGFKFVYEPIPGKIAGFDASRVIVDELEAPNNE